MTKTTRKTTRPRAFTGWAYPDEVLSQRIGIIYRYPGERGATQRVRITPLPAKSAPCLLTAILALKKGCAQKNWAGYENGKEARCSGMACTALPADATATAF
jgi:hypothetical protein